MTVIELADLDATRRFAEATARNVSVPMTIALNGTLGAGKTQWARFFCEALGVVPMLVTSPTYILVNLYRGRLNEIYHLDYYRLTHEAQVWDLGVDELQVRPVVLIVEWADKFPQTLAEDRIDVHLEQVGATARTASLKATGMNSSRILERVVASGF